MNATKAKSYGNQDSRAITCIARIGGVSYGPSQQNNMRVLFPLNFLDGPHAGTKKNKVNMLTTDASEAFLTKEMKKLGFELSDTKRFPEIEGKLDNLLVEVLIQPRKNAQPNYYFVKRVNDTAHTGISTFT